MAENWLRFIAKTTLIALGLIVPVAAVARDFKIRQLENKLAEHTAVYGTLEEPVYTLHNISGKSFPSAFEYTCKMTPKSYNEKEKKLAEFEDGIDSLEKALAEARGPFLEACAKEIDFADRENIEKRKAATQVYQPLVAKLNDDLEELNWIYFEKSPRIRLVEANLLSAIEMFTTIPYEAMEKKFGKIEDMASRVFTGLTGKPLPDGLEIEIEKLAKGHAGYHQFLKNKVKCADLGYAGTLLTHLHEFGHVCYQGQEDLVIKHVDSIQLNTEEMDAMEEAAAYFFMIAGTQKVEEFFPAIAKIMRYMILLERPIHLDKYKNASKEEHAVGWALADSILEHFDGNAGEAFNYISTKNQYAQLDESILKRFESLRKGYDRTELLAERRKAIDDRYKALKKIHPACVFITGEIKSHTKK